MWVHRDAAGFCRPSTSDHQCHAAKPLLLSSLPISRVSLQGAQPCWGGQMARSAGSSARRGLVLARIPLSSHACLHLHQPVPGPAGSKRIFTRCFFCVGLVLKRESGGFSFSCAPRLNSGRAADEPPTAGNFLSGRGCDRAADVRRLDLGVVSCFASRPLLRDDSDFFSLSRLLAR